MKKLKKRSLQAGALLVCASALAAGGHRRALRGEEKRLVPPGVLVKVEGRSIHIYQEGGSNPGPALVFLSGSGTVAPVYDFRPLYRLLSPNYPVVVAEKTGYGYSDLAGVPRDVHSMVNEVRAALSGAGVSPPYVLLPHSMSGLEALFWAQTYREEVAGIVGLDMAVPHAYDDFDLKGAQRSLALLGAACKLGIHRIPGLYPLQDAGLTGQEQEQLTMLMHRNAANPVHVREAQSILENVCAVQSQPLPDCPMLLFCSTAAPAPSWLENQRQFAQETGSELQILDCGHYLHYEKSPRLAEEIGRFLETELS